MYVALCTHDNFLIGFVIDRKCIKFEWLIFWNLETAFLHEFNVQKSVSVLCMYLNHFIEKDTLNHNIKNIIT